MSRIGKLPIAIPAGVTVTLKDDVVTVKGPKGELSQYVNPLITVTINDNEVVVSRSSDEKQERAFHGLYRALINNMVVGVSQGYSKTLEIIGVGYKAAKVGKTVQLYLGHSLTAKGVPQDKFIIEETDGITLEVADKVVPITITVKGIDKQAVGQMAAVIRSKRPPEPYHGKGVKYADERIRRKAGKTGK